MHERAFSRTPGTLTPPQQEVLACGLLSSGFPCVLQMPTGSGKTWLAEQAIAEVLQQGRRAVYLTPLRALAAELAGRWRERFSPAEVGVFTGDFGNGKALPVPFAEADLLVLTPERLDACTRAWRVHWCWLPEVDLCVVDEFHLLGDRTRGARLEGTLSRLTRLNPFARLLCLSATLGNRGELADWLGGTEYASSWRPVPLCWRVVRYRRATDKPALLLEELNRNVKEGGKSLVFVQSRRRAEELAGRLTDAGLQAGHHHAGLGYAERRATEDGFRAGAWDVLVATATLEMGLNLPVRQVVLYDLQAFDGADFRPLTTNSVWQRAGRAGRPGLDPSGEAVLLAPAWDRSADRYPEGAFEPIRSGLADRRALAEQIVVEAASGLARTEEQLGRLFRSSLAHRQGTLPDVAGLIREMCEAGLLRRGARGSRDATETEAGGSRDATETEEGEQGTRGALLFGTRLGFIACRHLLSPATVLLFARVLDAVDPSFFDLLLVACASGDCEPVLPVDFEELDALAGRVGQERSALLRLPRSRVVELLRADGKRLLAALKMAVVARDWTRTGDVQGAADRAGCYPFEIARLCESLGRLLLALGAAAAPDEDPDADGGKVDPDVIPVKERVAALQKMVAHGLDEEAVTLTLVGGVGARMAARLKQAGLGDIEALAQAEVADLAGVKGLSPKRAARWIEEATRIVRTRSAYRYREPQAPAPPQTGAGWPGGVDPYRLRRALDLRVSGQDGGVFRVVGGLEPHVVRLVEGGFLCDCADAAEGTLCKHVLAVRLHQRDRALVQAVRHLRSQGDGAIDLFTLWSSGGGPGDERRAE